MADLLGPRTAVAIDGVSVTIGPSVLSLRADHDLSGLATGRFSTPSCGVGFVREAWPADIEFLGFAFTQFALPVVAGAGLNFDFAPAPGLRSPRAMQPLIARSGDAVVLLAPLGPFHEQIVAVTEAGLMWGWHGDLDRVPAGFETRLAIYAADSIADALERWRDDLGVTVRPRSSNALTTHLSYWTDNGAAYWYRTEPGRTISESVVETVEALRADDVPVASVELDSWFYDHAIPRPITEVGYPAEVPPTGMVEWRPRADAFVADAGDADDGGVDPVASMQRRLDVPLVLHARHIAPASPSVTGPADWWIAEHAAHPKDPAFFRRWFDDARRWGATVLEQDWMQVYWFAIRELRSEPGRAAGWQRGLNDHATATDVDLLWCMATPADLMLASTLDRVIAVRTCDDYRFNDDPAFLWTWFLTVNRLADTLGLRVFKDCFFSNPDVGPGDDAIDGDPHAELEAALAALSGGPVGVGDRIGRTDRDVVMRTCDDNGRLRLVDRPIAALDRCMFGGPRRGDMLMWATTSASTASGTWIYVLAVNTADDVVTDRFDLDAPATVYDWRHRRTQRRDALELTLEPRDWSLFVVSPPGDERSAAEVGDPGRYVVVEAAETARPSTG